MAPFDLVINATGLLHDAAAGVHPEKAMRQVSADAMARVFGVNAIGPALIMKYFLPVMARDKKAVMAHLSARVGSISDNRLGGGTATVRPRRRRICWCGQPPLSLPGAAPSV